MWFQILTDVSDFIMQTLQVYLQLPLAHSVKFSGLESSSDELFSMSVASFDSTLIFIPLADLKNVS